MIEIVNAKDHGKIIPMSEMEPLEIGAICEVPDDHDYKGHIVMRTASEGNFEVMDLTNPGNDCCWTGRLTLDYIKVFIPKETIFRLNISNKK